MIKIKNLVYKSKEANFLLEVPNLLFSKAEVIAICGENGSGKSTFIDILTGMKSFDSGEIHIEDVEPIFSTVFQHSDFEEIKLVQIILFFVNLNELNNLINVNEFLQAYSLYELKDKKYNQLSFGQQQRFKFALSQIKNFSILIVDEILGGLDSKWRYIIKSQIQKIIKKKKMVILISHEISEIAELANRVLYFKEGQIIKDFLLVGNKREKTKCLLDNVDYLKEWSEDQYE